ncbi:MULTISPECIES: hypothetical protein [unclassified Enterobacter cloacae complex]|uniref:Uncharacterized protein n=2 Tax=Enterobacterales TaxID=91347 RepID=A0AAE7FCT7_CITFR|nr:MULTISPECIES: hypothetical protein [unclassified Enterobacter cloacae complex]MBJ9099589.1 hypothetical protein [Citrobacter freundii]MBY5189814.1 hypothetical protein [Escherichia coli]ASD59786.1 hypothetical protein WM95_14960 [Enterobacter cloacae complex sp. ECNIH7]MBJ9117679.1 hypothetical protein [Citrobacter freundii]MBJ9126731.1 hypothetical protein [Citrobacter freundii]
MERARILQMLMTCRQQAEQLRRLSGLAGLRESGEIGMSANALFQVAVIIESLISANEKALEGIARLDRSETQLIGERDQVIAALDSMYEAVTGAPPEWSNAFGFTDAINDVTERIFELENISHD